MTIARIEHSPAECSPQRCFDEDCPLEHAEYWTYRGEKFYDRRDAVSARNLDDPEELPEHRCIHCGVWSGDCVCDGGCA